MTVRAALALVVCAAVPFVLIASIVGVVGAPLVGDRAITLALQEPGWLVEPAKAVNLFGDYQYVSLAVVAAAALATAPRGDGFGAWAIAVVAAFAAAGVLLALDQFLKDAVRSPRPSFERGIAIHDTSSSYGFPSGHTFTATLVFGIGAAVVAMRAGGWRRALWIAAAFIAAITGGLARIVVGAHWPSDVLGGWLLGLAGIGVCLLVAELALRRAGRRDSRP